MTIDEVQEEIIEEFAGFDDWMDKYNYIIELASDLPETSEDLKKPENLISGCQSKVWIDAELKDGKIHFTADSDAIITKGIVALLLRVVNDREPKELLDFEPYFLDKIGLQQNLSPTRANGLLSMIKKIKLYAMAYNAKLNN